MPEKGWTIKLVDPIIYLKECSKIELYKPIRLLEEGVIVKLVGPIGMIGVLE